MSLDDDGREAVLDLVREDPELTPQEKETTFRFAKDQNEVAIYTAEAGISRRLLAHPSVRIEKVTVVDGDVRPTVALDEVNGRDIVAVRGSLPVGAVKIQLTPRATTEHAPVVSDRVFQTVEEGGRE